MIKIGSSTHQLIQRALEVVAFEIVVASSFSSFSNTSTTSTIDAAAPVDVTFREMNQQGTPPLRALRLNGDEVVEVLQNTGPVIKYFGIIYNSNTYEKEKRGKYGVKYGPDRATEKGKFNSVYLELKPRIKEREMETRNDGTESSSALPLFPPASSPSTSRLRLKYSGQYDLRNYAIEALSAVGRAARAPAECHRVGILCLSQRLRWCERGCLGGPFGVAKGDVEAVNGDIRAGMGWEPERGTHGSGTVAARGDTSRLIPFVRCGEGVRDSTVLGTAWGERSPSSGAGAISTGPASGISTSCCTASTDSGLSPTADLRMPSRIFAGGADAGAAAAGAGDGPWQEGQAQCRVRVRRSDPNWVKAARQPPAMPPSPSGSPRHPQAQCPAPRSPQSVRAATRPHPRTSPPQTAKRRRLWPQTPHPQLATSTHRSPSSLLPHRTPVESARSRTSTFALVPTENHAGRRLECNGKLSAAKLVLGEGPGCSCGEGRRSEAEEEEGRARPWPYLIPPTPAPTATLWLVHDIPPSPTLDDSIRLAAACARTHDGGSGSTGARIPHLRTRHHRAPRIPAHIRTHLPAQACAAKDDTGKDEGEGKRGGVTPCMSTSISSPGPICAGADIGGKTTRSIARIMHSPLAKVDTEGVISCADGMAIELVAHARVGARSLKRRRCRNRDHSRALSVSTLDNKGTASLGRLGFLQPQRRISRMVNGHCYLHISTNKYLRIPSRSVEVEASMDIEAPTSRAELLCQYNST
ncbi:hypothetical protein B0H14DRAFT_2622275 [Mycena olivaceomarginata]|nr:hypothetical protein B0H14DRAFT_2622275 [Mycena olivaceomarginata]